MPRPVPVMFVSPHAVLGGAEAVLCQLITELGPDWVAGIVVLQDGPLVDELRSAGFAVDVIPTGPKASMVASAYRLRCAVARQRPAVVHANGVKAALVAGMALLARPEPLLWMKHDLAGDGTLARLVASRSDRIVGVSDTVLRTFPTSMRERTVRVYNGVPTRSLDRDDARTRIREVLEVPPGTRVIALAGRLCLGKGQHELLQAAPAILAEQPRTVFALIGGPDPAFPRHRARLIDQARLLGVEAAVRFTGRRADAVTLIGGSDLVAMPSVLDPAHGWREGFGLVGVEAMQVGTPVVAYDSGALAEVLGDAAVLVAENDHAALGRALVTLLQDEPRRALLASRGRARVAERFTLKSSVEGLRTVYRTLAGSRP